VAPFVKVGVRGEAALEMELQWQVEGQAHDSETAALLYEGVCIGVGSSAERDGGDGGDGCKRIRVFRQPEA
jgi:hypothetical protein